MQHLILPFEPPQYHAVIRLHRLRIEHAFTKLADTRELVCTGLEEALREGRLTREEYDARVYTWHQVFEEITGKALATLAADPCLAFLVFEDAVNQYSDNAKEYISQLLHL